MVKIVSRIDKQEAVVAKPSKNVDGFEVRRGLEGRQIVIKWGTIPFSYESIRLVRKKLSYPEHINDGVVLINETPPSSQYYIDLDVDILNIYYYQLFYYKTSEDWVAETELQGRAFTFDTGTFQDKLWQLMPGQLHADDSESNQIALEAEPDQNADYEIRKLHEDRLIDMGELQRFLKIFSLYFDEIKGLIDFMPTLFDVDNTDPDFLPLIAELVGVKFNREISIPRQRAEIRNAIFSYKRKGTIPGIESFVSNVSGYKTVVYEAKKNVARFNDGRTKFRNFSQARPNALHIEENDSFSYFMSLTDKEYIGYDKLWIIIYLKESYSLDKFQVDKINRLMHEWIPYDCLGKLLLTYIPVIENFTSFNTEDSFYDIIT